MVNLTCKRCGNGRNIVVNWVCDLRSHLGLTAADVIELTSSGWRRGRQLGARSAVFPSGVNPRRAGVEWAWERLPAVILAGFNRGKTMCDNCRGRTPSTYACKRQILTPDSNCQLTPLPSGLIALMRTDPAPPRRHTEVNSIKIRRGTIWQSFLVGLAEYCD